MTTTKHLCFPAYDSNSCAFALGTSPIESDAVQWLAKMVQVLDDQEVLVIHVEHRKGYRLVMGGVSDNFQLHTLLARALIGDPSHGWLLGTVPPPGQGVWNLVNWTGLRPDKTLGDAEIGTGDFRDSSEHWIWGEGVPGDIAPFEGKLVVLLDKPPYARSWNPDQLFSSMEPSLEVLEVLNAAQVEEWVSRLAKAASQLADENQSSQP